MKRNLLLIVFLIYSFTTLAQTPEKFHYQALLRNSTEELIKNTEIDVKISILEESSSGTASYVEEHTVTTNNFGVFEINIGSGTFISGSFSAIDWSSLTFLQTEIAQPSGGTYTMLGAVQLISVPYALYAKNVANNDDFDADSLNEIQSLQLVGDTLKISNSNSLVLPYDSSNWSVNSNNLYYNKGNVGIGSSDPISTLEIKSENTTDALFQVINTNNDTVFAVYSDGVQVFVDPTTKGRVGGFAISGRSPSKAGETIPYMKVTADSTRIYVNDPVKGKVGGFAISGRSPAKSTAINFLYLTPENYFIGHQSGEKNDGGLYNSFLGFETGYNNTTGDFNVFLGYRTGYSNNLGTGNIFLGPESGYNNTQGSYNVFLGHNAGYSNLEGHDNVFVGQSSGYSNNSGTANVFVGQNSGESNFNGTHNVFLGYQTGYTNTSGTRNLFIGTQAGYNQQAGNYNVFIGNEAGYNDTTSNKLYIENSNENNLNALIYGDFETNKLRFNANVGVGIDAEEYKLNVNGNINFYGDLYKDEQLYNPGLVKAQLSEDLGSPAPYENLEEGFMVYNDGENQPKGFFYWNGNEWLMLLSASGPEVTTDEVTNINLTSADCGGDVTAEGGSSVLARGVCWNTTGSPTINDSHSSDGTGTGVFTSSMSGLTENTTYYVRAYAINSTGTKYGESMSFVTDDQPIIIVNTPTSTTSWLFDYTFTIKWSDNISEDIKLELYKGGAFHSTIAASVISDGSYDWTIPTILAGTDYQVKVTGTILTDVSDLSDNFEIVEPELEVITPSEAWIAGNQHTIAWTDNINEDVKIELFQNAILINEIAYQTSSDGSYEFSVPSDLETETNYTIVITSILNSNVNAVSDEFSIIGLLTDFDSNKYKTVLIGNQIWMAENLKATHYSDGTAITSYAYDNNASNVDIYGRLYTWASAMNNSASSATNPSGVKGACPDGWHIPSDDEWKELEVSIGMSLSVVHNTGYRGTNEGSKLAGNSTLWNNGLLESNSAFDLLDFKALPGGYRHYSDFGSYLLKEYAFFWSSTEENGTEGYIRRLYYNNSGIYRSGYIKGNSFSVRCVKD